MNIKEQIEREADRKYQNELMRSIDVHVLLGSDCEKGFYSYAMGKWIDRGNRGVITPTHWQPLPSLPPDKNS